MVLALVRVPDVSAWIWSGRTALLAGGVLFAVLFVPIVVSQYRRWGGWNGKRLAGAAAASVYGVALATYTWLPLPPRTLDYCAQHASTANFVPFHSVGDIVRASEGLSVVDALTSFTFLQVFFNVVLFVPLGIIVRRILNRGIGTAVLAGLATTVFIEATQYTGLWGIYPCAYRVADVDDVIANTLGALVGALIAPAVLWWMPRAHLLTYARLRPRPVTPGRRLLGQAADFILLTGITWGLYVPIVAAEIALGRTTINAVPLPELIGCCLVAWVVVCVIPPWRHLAASPGQTSVWLTPVWLAPDGTVTHGTLARRLIRANVVALPSLLALVDLFTGDIAFTMLATGVSVAAVLSVFGTAGARGLTCVLTGAEMRDIRSLTLPGSDIVPETQDAPANAG